MKLNSAEKLIENYDEELKKRDYYIEKIQLSNANDYRIDVTHYNPYLDIATTDLKLAKKIIEYLIKQRILRR